MREHAGSNEDREAAEARYQRALQRLRDYRTCERCAFNNPDICGQFEGCPESKKGN